MFSNLHNDAGSKDYFYILWQVHDVEFAPNLDVIVNETLPALEQVVKSGKARYIGVTGFPVKVLKELIDKSKTKIDAVLSYSRLTLLDDVLVDFLPGFKVCKYFFLRILDR